MVLRKSTEISCKKRGNQRTFEIFEPKINEQKELFDQKIADYNKNIKEKEQLIKDLKEYIEKNSEKDEFKELVSLAESCLKVLERDVHLTKDVNANSVIKELDIRLGLSRK